MISAVKIVALLLLACSLSIVSSVSAAERPPGVPTEKASNQLGAFPQWSKVEVELTGPSSTGMGAPNPFLIEVDVTFTGPGGTFVVPAFYDGDGAGDMDGNVWKARFAPNATGAWSYESSSAEGTLDGETDTFTVTAPSGCSAYVPGALPDFLCVGRLEGGGGEHYLQFNDGTFWLKGGVDEPEHFLGPGLNFGFASKEAALTYLAGKGVNSHYIMTQNIDGDGQNVWPYVGANNAAAKTNHERIDVAKMLEWEEWFDHMQGLGMVIHMVFEDDSGWPSFNRDLYYREMIARFGHYNGLIFNISEEYNENYSSGQVATFAATIKSIDPYDHPVTVHNQGSLDAWDPFLGNTNFDLTSFQDNVSPWNGEAGDWFDDVEGSGHTIPVSFDETSALDTSERTLARRILWEVYVGGANFEMFTQPLNDYEDYDAFWGDMTRARGLVESLPFNEMRPANDLLSGGTGFAFAQAGEAYLVFLPNGGDIDLNLVGNSNTFDAFWFDPLDGSIDNLADVVGGSTESFSAPSSSQHWALVLEMIVGGGNVAPTANNQSATTDFETPINLTLTFSDPDGPGPNVVTIVNNVDFGVLTGSGVNRTYTPDAAYDGPDSFTWSINDGEDESNIATFSLTVDPEVIVNEPPVADDDDVIVAEDSEDNSIQLVYTDPDGPGPFVVTIVNDVDNGTLTGADNDRFYTPDPGYDGPDQFTWSVNDGEDESNIATVDITVTPPANTPPTAQNDSVTTPEDTLLEITLTATDPETCELTSFSILTPPIHGDLGTLTAQTCVGGSPNTDSVLVDYTPDSLYSGPDSFTWRANDGTDNSNTATITITVSSINATLLLSIQEGEAGGWSIPFDVILFSPVGGPYTASEAFTPTAASTGDENGQMVITVTPGMYDIWAKGETTLAVLESAADLTAEPPDPVDLGLQSGGDFTGDNIVNGDDFIPLLLTFGQATGSLSAPDQLNDHNQNGFVDILDFRIIIGNYLSVGVAEPACCS